MSIIGIIAEFNPFHNGHAHLFRSLPTQGDNLIICILSGPFTQRGEAALLDKWARARMAVVSGADLVVELPFFYAVRSAHDFARGSIHILNSLKVTHLAFGSEHTNETFFRRVAETLSQEPPAYKENLHKHLQRGEGFAAARSAALQEYFPKTDKLFSNFLNSPNMILALEYFHVLTAEGLPITPILISRQGGAYHDKTLQNFASAYAIRSYLYNHIHDFKILRQTMPESVYEILQAEIDSGYAPFERQVLDTMILFQLRTASIQSLATTFEMREGLENRIFQYAFSCGTLEKFISSISGRRYPKSRIRRLLLYILLKLTQSQADELQKLEVPHYIRILAANNRGLQYLKQIKSSQKSAPVFLASGREIKKFLQQTNPALAISQQLLQLDIKASNLYSLGASQPDLRIGNQDFYQHCFFYNIN